MANTLTPEYALNLLVSSATTERESDDDFYARIKSLFDNNRSRFLTIIVNKAQHTVLPALDYVATRTNGERLITVPQPLRVARPMVGAYDFVTAIQYHQPANNIEYELVATESDTVAGIFNLGSLTVMSANTEGVTTLGNGEFPSITDLNAAFTLLDAIEKYRGQPIG